MQSVDPQLRETEKSAPFVFLEPGRQKYWRPCSCLNPLFVQLVAGQVHVLCPEMLPIKKSVCALMSPCVYLAQNKSGTKQKDQPGPFSLVRM